VNIRNFMTSKSLNAMALRTLTALAAVCMIAIAPLAVAAQLVTGLEGGSGSTIGPGGALFVTEGAAGRVSRVDPQTGDVSTFASGLPPSLIGIGGAMDVVFIGSKAYVLVTLVGFDVGGNDVVGIYRVDGPSDFTVIADLGAYSVNNPPDTSFFLPTGVQYAIEAYRGGFLVSDGHHNRVLRVTLDGEISESTVFGNTVPTGLAISGNTVYVAKAGPIPHLAEDGQVVAYTPQSPTAVVVASGAELVVDVEFGRGRTLYALSQGTWDGVMEGSPAQPNTGSLVQVNADGTFSVVVDGLDRPTSMQFIGNTAYIVTLGGDIVKIDDVSSPPFGKAR
jgi:sugar lactone lactonase YvrE